MRLDFAMYLFCFIVIIKAGARFGRFGSKAKGNIKERFS